MLVDLGTHQLDVEVAGTGPPLLFLPGTGGGLDWTRRMSATFERSATVIRLDHRGVGRSSGPASPWSVADYAADAALVARHVGYREVDVIGFSFGGMVAQELAVAEPDLVRRLALVSTSSGGPGGASHPLTELGTLPLEERSIRHLALADRRYLPGMDGESWDVQLQYLRSAPPAPDVAERQRSARLEHDAWARLTQIGAPTLVCGGVYDQIAPPRNQVALVGAIRGARLRLFGAGHLLLLDDVGAPGAIAASFA